MAFRAIWTGLLGFGLVSVPVKLFSGTESKDISFNQLCKTCHSKINQIKKCGHCDKELAMADLDKGFEYTKGQYVVITEQDLEALPLPTKKQISISQFINAVEIDPIHYEKTYFLEPSVGAEKPFALFMEAVRSKNKIGLAKFTLRTKERLCAIRPYNNTLLLTTLLYPDEVRIGDGKTGPIPPALSEQEITMGQMLVDMMSKPFNPGEIKDTYREALTKVIEAKVEGKTLEAVPEIKTQDTGSLFDALTATLAALKAGQK